METLARALRPDRPPAERCRPNDPTLRLLESEVLLDPRLAPAEPARTRALPSRLPEGGAQVRGVCSPAGPFGVRLLGLSRLIRAAVLPHASEIRRTWDGQLQQLIADMDACDTVDPVTLTTPQLLAHRLAIETVARRYMEPDLAIYVVKMAASYTVEQIGVRLRGDKDPSFLTDLTSGLSDNRTLRMNQELETLLGRFSTDPLALDLVVSGAFRSGAGESLGRAGAGARRLHPAERPSHDELGSARSHVE